MGYSEDETTQQQSSNLSRLSCEESEETPDANNNHCQGLQRLRQHQVLDSLMNRLLQTISVRKKRKSKRRKRRRPNTAMSLVTLALFLAVAEGGLIKRVKRNAVIEGESQITGVEYAKTSEIEAFGWISFNVCVCTALPKLTYYTFFISYLLRIHWGPLLSQSIIFLFPPAPPLVCAHLKKKKVRAQRYPT